MNNQEILLERIAVALETIAEKFSSVPNNPPGKVWLSDVEGQCKPSAKRWFQCVYDNYPEIKFAEQITEHHLNHWQTFQSDTKQHIREKLSEMIESANAKP